MIGRLPRSRSPPQPKTAPRRPPRAQQLARGGEHALQRVGRVRVVHHHQEGLAGLHALESAGHGRHAGRAPRRCRGVHLRARARRRSRRGDSSRCARPRGATRSRGGPSACPTVHANAVHAGVGTGAAGCRRWPCRPKVIACGTRRGPRHHRRARRIVGVDHRGAPRLAAGREQGEQAGLGVAIGLEGPVEVEMILGQVGEDRHVELDARPRGESARACEETSIAAPADAALTMRARSDCSSSASGVVWLAVSA